MDLNGAVAVVTGAGGGIGAAMVGELLGIGARVVGLDVDAGALAALASGVDRTRQSDLLCVHCDITNADSCSRAVEQVIAHFGHIHALINNAGITHWGTCAETPLRTVQRVMDVNFFGAVRCTKAALPHLIERKGIIVVISSVAGFAPLVCRSSYAASKHALHGYFDTARTELADAGVDVLIVCPSFTKTAIMNKTTGALEDATWRRKTPGGEATPQSVARSVVEATVERRKLAVLSPVGKAAWWLSRLAPSVYARLMLATQRKNEP